MEPSLDFNKEEISLAKIVANPTQTSWSQVYNAGSLFAALSLSYNLPPEEDDALNILGREILDILEKEYYTLEEKNLNSIKEAISLAAQKIPEQFLASFVVGAIIKAEKPILYTFSFGGGKTIVKRGDKIGEVLGSAIESKSLSSASGFLEDNDIIILETRQFASVISNQELSQSLDNLPPLEIAENLSPKIHEKEEGGAAAIIISYQKLKTQEDLILENIEEIEEVEQEEEPSFTSLQNKISSLKSRFLAGSSGLPHSKKVFLTIAFILFVILISSIFFAIKKGQDAKTQALFQDAFISAQKSYDEGQGLVSLNKNLARVDFQKAQKILEEAKPKFSSNSKEVKEISNLLSKVTDALSSVSGENTVEAKAVNDDQSAILFFEKSSSSIISLTQDARNIYFVDDKGINQTEKSTKKSKTIIKNEKFWQTPGGLGVYLSNVYLLDKKANQIFKFLSGSFSKSNYLSGSESVDFSNASSLTIDGSIYVLFSDGNIKKFTKGKSESFSVKGLDKPFSTPSRIFTSLDANNIYVLDNGNSRIVVLDKSGNYQAQYKSNILKNAKDFEVLEPSKKIYLLSQSKIYQIELK